MKKNDKKDYRCLFKRTNCNMSRNAYKFFMCIYLKFIKKIPLVVTIIVLLYTCVYLFVNSDVQLMRKWNDNGNEKSI